MTKKQKIEEIKEGYPENLHFLVEEIIESYEELNGVDSIIYPFDSTNFFQIWDMWKEVKRKEHNFKYKSEISEQAALRKLARLSNGNEEIAIAIINQSIEEGWKGFFKLKNDGKEKRDTEDYKRSILNDLQS